MTLYNVRGPVAYEHLVVCDGCVDNQHLEESVWLNKGERDAPVGWGTSENGERHLCPTCTDSNRVGERIEGGESDASQ